MEIKELPIESIIPYDKNAKMHPQDQIDHIANSLERFGWKQPVVVDKDNVVIAGHGRLLAAKQLGWDLVPVLYADDLTEEEVRAFRLADNKTNESTWDDELLNFELGELADSIDMSDFGFDLSELEDDYTEVTEDEYNEPLPENPKTKRGDIYQLGVHRLICGDSTDAADIGKLMGGEKADMVFTDPPWNVNYGAVDSDNRQGYNPRTIMNDFMGTEEFKKFMFSAFERMNEASKSGACTYVVMSAQEWGNMMLTLAENDYHWSSTIIWKKDTLVLSRKDYHTQYEPIWYGWKSGARLCPLEDRKQSDVWEFDRPKRSEEHPTMKPVGLVARAVQNSSKKGDIVVDLFGGSGTTMIACEQTDRICYMSELDPKYCDVIVDRWEKFTGEKAVLLENEK